MEAQKRRESLLKIAGEGGLVIDPLDKLDETNKTDDVRNRVLEDFKRKQSEITAARTVSVPVANKTDSYTLGTIATPSESEKGAGLDYRVNLYSIATPSPGIFGSMRWTPWRSPTCWATSGSGSI